MVENPQLECLPEHRGPAFNTWQLIMQTAMEKSLQPSQAAMERSPQPSPPLEPSPSPVVPDINTTKKPSTTPDELLQVKSTPGGGSKSTDDPPGGGSVEESSSDTGTTTEECTSNRKKSLTSSCSIESSEDGISAIGIGVAHAPWKSYEKYPQNTRGLHLEIIDFYRHISPLPEEEVMRQDVVRRMSDLITSILPGAKVEVFGSFQTCLYLPSSDIDLAVFGDWDKLPLFIVREALISSDVAELNSVIVLDKATVPIIKLRDKLSKVRVDISFNTDASVKSVAMIKSYLKKFPLLPYLFLTLKHFLVQRDLNEVFTGGISSYCLLLLTVSFFQRPEHRMYQQQVKDQQQLPQQQLPQQQLPQQQLPQQQLPQQQLSQQQLSQQQVKDLGVLLMEFLELYGRNLNYQRIGIKIKNGGCYISKDKLSTDLANGEYPALLCIEDPVTLATDIGKSSYGILRVKEAFEDAFNVIDKALRTKYYFKVNPNSTYLSRIISITQELHNYRRWVRKTYRPMLNLARTGLPRSLYQDNVHSQSDGKPPLLPTPALYSPRVHLPGPPFSPFTTNSNGIVFSHFGFIGNNKVGPQQQLSQQQLSQQQLSQQQLSQQQLSQQQLSQQQLSQQQITQQQLSQQQIIPQQLLIGNITNNVSTCVQNKQEPRVPLHTNQPNSTTTAYLSRLPHDNSNSMPCLPGYVLPRMVNSSSHKHYVMKTKNNNPMSQANKIDKLSGYQGLTKVDFHKSQDIGASYRTYSAPKSCATTTTRIDSKGNLYTTISPISSIYNDLRKPGSPCNVYREKNDVEITNNVETCKEELMSNLVVKEEPLMENKSNQEDLVMNQIDNLQLNDDEHSTHTDSKSSLHCDDEIEVISITSDSSSNTDD